VPLKFDPEGDYRVEERVPGKQGLKPDAVRAVARENPRSKSEFQENKD